MTTAKRRIDKLETGLTPKQAILLWLQEAHSFNTIEEYVLHLKTQPDSAAPIGRLTSQVAESVKQTLKGRPQEEINKAVNQAYKDVLCSTSTSKSTASSSQRTDTTGHGGCC